MVVILLLLKKLIKVLFLIEFLSFEWVRILITFLNYISTSEYLDIYLHSTQPITRNG